METFYKGYIVCRNKKAIVSFKSDDDLIELESAQRFPEYAGVLDDNTVLIDIDDPEQSEILLNIVKAKQLKCRVIRTSRGYHFLFWNNDQIIKNYTHCKLSIGLTADIKGCGKASYEILKTDGVEREVVYDTNEYQTVPRWLTPIKARVELLNMVEGEGRNNALFSYILPLQQNEFTIEECRECIRIINDFILREPLSDSELNGILREGAFNKPCFFTARGGFQFDVFAKYFQRLHNIIRINENLYIYRDGYYQQGDKFIEAAMIDLVPTLSMTKRKEVLAYLELIVPENSTLADAHLVAFKNGVLNVITNEMYDFNPEYIITNKIPHKYVPNAQSDILNKTMMKLACDDEQIEQLLYQAIGMCLFRKNELRKSFFLLGEKRNGKSTFLDMVSTLLGEANIANLDLAEVGDKYKTAELVGKLANIGDDIDDEYIAKSSIFKKVVSGDKITIEKKHKDPFVFGSYAKFFFSANAIPRIGKGRDSAAILDRLVVIPFDAKFDKNDPDYDPFIKYKLREEAVIEALIAKAVIGLRDVLAEQAFIVCDKVKDITAAYERDNNPILDFFDGLSERDYVNEPTDDVYIKYKGFCLKNECRPMRSAEFKTQMKKYFDLEVRTIEVNNKKVFVYQCQT